MEKTKFNKDWLFHRGSGSSLEALMGGNSDALSVTLPHDASIGMDRNPEEPGGSGNGFFREECYHYTKRFSLEAADADRDIWLEFEGIYQNAFVYVNGAFAGKCPYGYGNFYLDITKYVHFDAPNDLKVVVKNGVPSGRWYTGGGIYRDVNLMIADRLHLEPDGVQLAAVEVEDDQAIVRVRSSLAYTGTGVQDAVLEICLLDENGVVVAQDTMPVTVEAHSSQVYQQRLYVPQPQLWDADHPYLYTYHATVRTGDTVRDTQMGTFGIRRLQLDRAHGFRVNGKMVQLRGGCIHHDNGVTGTAEFPHTAEFRVRRLKEAGYNAIRSSHYPMSRRLLEACDRLGMYVMDEFSDVWTTTKVDFDYGMHMAQWWEHDVDNLVRKDYNHPCVVMYSIGNEIPETGNKFDTQWGKKLADRIRLLDDSRYVTNSLNLMLSIMDRIPQLMAQMSGGPAGTQDNPEINSMMSNMGDVMGMLITIYMAGEAIAESAAQVDVIGYNYGAARYVKDGEKYPNRIIVGSETFPRDLDKNWELVEKYPYVIGDFSWTAWDYLGEAGIGKINYEKQQTMGFYAPYPYKAAYCGDMNLIGDRRPISYWRELIWGLREAPYLAVQPPMHHDDPHEMTEWSMTDAVRSWNWNGFEGRAVTVEVYAAADEAELFVNGQSVGRKPVGEQKKYMALFETTYEPGEIEVVTYRGSEACGRDRIVTASDQVRIQAIADRTSIPADESDIAYVEISMVDINGTLNPGANAMVSISIEGPGVIVGYGSADPGSEENYFDTTAKAYEGRLRAAVRGCGQTGRITGTLTSPDCEDVKVTLEAV